MPLVALLLGYLLGSFPSAVILARLKGRNIFEVGSGNMGAMNTARNLGWGVGVGVLLLDVGKGALASYGGLLLGGTLLAALLGGFGAVLGHAFSLYIGFRGGKALATSFGMALPLAPLAALVALIVLVLLIGLLKRVNLASVVIIALAPFLVVGEFLYRETVGAGLAFGIFTMVTVVVIAKHLPELRAELKPA